MARRLVRSGRRSGPRRTTFWESASSTAMVAMDIGGTTQVVQAIVTEASLDNVPNPTLVRVRGEIFSQLGAAANAQGDAILVAHAIQVVDAKQFAIGPTALPMPITNNSEDFLWYGSSILAQNDQTTVLNNQSNFDRIHVDSKSMRKISINQVLVMCTEIALLSGGTGEDINFALILRMLFKK